MATWRDMARQNLLTARALRSEDRRGSLSRLYYAVYCLVTGRVEHLGPWKRRPETWQNPPHDRIQGLTAQMPGVGKAVQAQCEDALKDLFEARKIADYKPAGTIDDDLVREMFSLAEGVFSSLKEKL